MDFDLDDPLGDLLSDGSNDSFFGTAKKVEPKKSTKSPFQSSSDAKPTSKIADLFGINSNTATKATELDTQPNPVLKTPQSRAKASAEPRKSISKEEIGGNAAVDSQYAVRSSTPTRALNTRSTTPTADAIAKVEPERSARKQPEFDDSNDFLNELGFDPKRPKGSSSAKKSNILDDILNFSRTDPVAKPAAAPTTSKPTTSGTDRTNSKPAEENPSTNRYSPSSGRARNLPRSGSGDPLGFFTKPSQEAKKEENIPATTRSKMSKKPAIDWLGLDTENETKPEEIAPAVNETKAKPVQQNEIPKTVQSAPVPTPAIASVSIAPAVTMPVNIPAAESTNTASVSTNLNLMNISTLEKEQALHSLQHKETQLRIATQMKHQENMLHDVHAKQQALIKLQENQFNELLRRQIDRQNELETQIQQQQEQINAYISVLMNQPSSIGLIGMTKMPAHNSDDHQNDDGDVDTSRQHFIELEADVKRLELEKLRLEDTLQSVQTAHEQELQLLHSSHKKQISLLEENLESLEKRLREEIKSTESYHLNKIEALQSDLDVRQQKHDEQIEKLIADYEKQIAKLRLTYEQDLEALKLDQRSTIENIRQAKLYEFAALQESGSYLNTLKSASDNLEHATDNLQSLRTNIDSTIERIHAEREVHLNAKEERLNEQQKHIEKNVEKTEEERNRLIELVRSLEIKLNSMEQSSTEEQWNLRQRTATLEAEKVSFEREKKFTREKLSTEEKRIQELKDSHFEEHKRLMDLLDAEREQILVEKAKLETMERLKMPLNSSTKRQSELDAAIKIAQDAAKSAEVEREKFLEQQRRNESKRHELMEKENHLQAQQSELELRLGQAKDQKQIAEHATRTCKALEQKLLAKLQSLQENYIELTEREAKFSQAKMELGKERMELHRLRQQLRSSKCSLCRIGAQNRDISEMDPLDDITTVNDKPGPKLDFFAMNSSFDGLQQRLSNADFMIDLPTQIDFSNLRPNASVQDSNLLQSFIEFPPHTSM